mgnify:CR=1 FL=1
MQQNTHFLRQAIALAYTNAEKGGRPFGAVVVRNGQVIAQAVNEMMTTNDPTAHAELLAIRAASQQLGSANLAGCSVFASGHPCPMCMAAMRLAGINEVTYAYSNEDGAPYGLSTADIYADLARPFSEQSMIIRHAPCRLDDRPDLYAHWKQQEQKGK